jgi:hypothetical protein
VRVPVDELPLLLRRLVDGDTTWAEVAAQYPAQAATGEEA